MFPTWNVSEDPEGILCSRFVGWTRVPHHGFLTFYTTNRIYTANFCYERLVGIRIGEPTIWLPDWAGGGSVGPWEVLEHVHAALECLEYPSDQTNRIRDYVAQALKLSEPGTTP